MPKNSLVKLGGFALIDDYQNKKNPTTNMINLEGAVQQAVANHKRHFPTDVSLTVYLHEKTAERFGVNGSVAGLPVRRDHDVPEGYVWVTNANEI